MSDVAQAAPHVEGPRRADHHACIPSVAGVDALGVVEPSPIRGDTWIGVCATRSADLDVHHHRRASVLGDLGSWTCVGRGRGFRGGRCRSCCGRVGGWRGSTPSTCNQNQHANRLCEDAHASMNVPISTKFCKSRLAAQRRGWVEPGELPHVVDVTAAAPLERWRARSVRPHPRARTYRPHACAPRESPSAAPFIADPRVAKERARAPRRASLEDFAIHPSAPTRPRLRHELELRADGGPDPTTAEPGAPAAQVRGSRRPSCRRSR